MPEFDNSGGGGVGGIMKLSSALPLHSCLICCNCNLENKTKKKKKWKNNNNNKINKNNKNISFSFFLRLAFPSCSLVWFRLLILSSFSPCVSVYIYMCVYMCLCL